MKKYKKVKLIDIIEFQRGKDLTKENMKNGKYPVVGSNGIIGYHNKFTTEKPSITIGRSGNVGRPFIYDGKSWSHNTTLYIKKFKSINPYYIYYLLKNLHLEEYGGGSTVPTLNRNDIHQQKVYIPEDLRYQNEVSNFFISIDKKINLNNKINDNLEKQLVSYYTYYFLQNNTSTEKISLDKVADLYQPETISIKQLDDNLDYFVFGANGIIGKYHKYNHENYQIAIACRGANCGITLMTLPKSWITGNAMVVKPKEYFPYKEFLYQTLKLKSPSYLTSGSAQPQITRENLSLYEIDINDKKKLDKFENFASRIRKNIISNKLENISLIKLREFLLPILMNGQATISE